MMNQSVETMQDPAVEDVYERLRGDLERAVRRMCPYWLSDRGDDLIQVGLLKVMNLRKRSEKERDFSPTYLWRVAYSALIDEIRRLRRAHVVPIAEQDRERGVWLPSRDADPEKNVSGIQIGTAIRECLKGLIKPRRLAVTLYLQGHGVPECVQVLGWNSKRIENLIYRGLQNLRDCLTTKGHTP